jgi:hypothetical protein
VDVIQPTRRLTREQLVLLASWLVVSATLAVVGVVTWLQAFSLLAGAFWVAAAVVALATVALGLWYRSRPGASRRW